MMAVSLQEILDLEDPDDVNNIMIMHRGVEELFARGHLIIFPEPDGNFRVWPR